MVKILAGEKGEGKTKRMIDMANAAGKEAKGNIVFVDDDNSHMYDLHYSVRFVETPKFIMEDPQVFRGFVCGILSQNSDIETIYIDGLNHIMDRISDADFTASCSFADSRTDGFGLLQACRTGTDITGFYIHCNLFCCFQLCTVHFLKFVHVCSPFLVSLHDFVKKNKQRIVLFFHFCIQNTFYSLYFSTKKAKK